MTIPLARASLVAAVLLCAGALGRVLLRRVAVASPARKLVCEQLLGLLLYLALYGLAVEVGVRRSTVAMVAVALGALAGLSLLHEAWTSAPALARRAAVCAAAGAALVALGAVQSSPGAWDPLVYALSASTAFRLDWLRDNAPVIPLPMRTYLLDLARNTEVTRAPSVALLWAPAALGVPVDVGFVAQVGVWCELASAALVADLLRGLGPVLVRVVVAIGSVGVFSVVSALAGGQISQAVAILVVLATVWICRAVEHRGTRLLALGLMGNLVVAAYPELLVALPAYLVCIVAADGMSWRRAMSDAAAVVAGAAVVAMTVGPALARYLISQTSLSPGWTPLAATPRGVLGLWRTIVWQEATVTGPLVAGALVIVALAVARARPTAEPRPPAPRPGSLAPVGTIALMVVVWSWLVLRSVNVNYATFKLGGWLGPALVLLAWLGIQRMPPAAWRVALVLLVALASVRAADLLIRLPAIAPRGIAAWQPRVWTTPPAAAPGPCTVQAVSDSVVVVFTAMVESAAPARGCAITVGPRPDVAAAYHAEPPRTWRAGASLLYPLWVMNASAAAWPAEGVGARRLGVRFLREGTAPGEWRWFPLPNRLPLGARVALNVELATPGARGEYRLEHRLARDGDVWSEQALLRPLRLD